MDHSADKSELYRLMLQAIEEGISNSDFARLEQMLQDSPECRETYSDLSIMYAFLRRPAVTFESTDPHRAFDKIFWKELAAYEKSAPGIEILHEKPPRELVKKVLYPRHEKRKTNKFGLVFLAMNTAAILFFFLFLRFVPLQGGHEAATLTDSLNAKWINPQREMSNGTPIRTGDESLLLREGYAEFLFHNQVKVTLEGPAELQILTDDQIKLVYGQLYAVVPHEAIGFTVKTPTAQIVDLGTEFGVICDLRSNTSLHVLKGKTVLIAGDKSNKVSVEVKEGDAKRVPVESRTISDISCNNRLFVREIDSAGHFIWRGETQISLADIVGGGNGFGTVRSVIALDPATGKYVSSINRHARSSKNRYSLVPDSPFIDGVFVADGGPDGRAIVTSSGDTFQCPDTKGLVTHEITVYTGAIETQQDTIPPAIFQGRRYDNAIMMIHSNAGITFDLQAIRQSLPGLEVTGFKAFGGLSEALRSVKTQLPDIDYWVLVDGQIRYEKKALTLDSGEISFNVELSPRDRFLTLIVTDGSRLSDVPRGYTVWNNDFFYLVDPKLQLAETVE